MQRGGCRFEPGRLQWCRFKRASRPSPPAFRRRRACGLQAATCDLGGPRRRLISDKFIGGTYDGIRIPRNDVVPRGPLVFRRIVWFGGTISLEKGYGLITAIHKCGQADKGAWWMPKRAEAMKDVVGCDKLRGAAKQALIRRCPNGATRRNWATSLRHRRLNA